MPQSKLKTINDTKRYDLFKLLLHVLRTHAIYSKSVLVMHKFDFITKFQGFYHVFDMTIKKNRKKYIIRKMANKICEDNPNELGEKITSDGIKVHYFCVLSKIINVLCGWCYELNTDLLLKWIRHWMNKMNFLEKISYSFLIISQLLSPQSNGNGWRFFLLAGTLEEKEKSIKAGDILYNWIIIRFSFLTLFFVDRGMHMFKKRKSLGHHKEAIQIERSYWCGHDDMWNTTGLAIQQKRQSNIIKCIVQTDMNHNVLSN